MKARQISKVLLVMMGLAILGACNNQAQAGGSAEERAAAAEAAINAAAAAAANEAASSTAAAATTGPGVSQDELLSGVWNAELNGTVFATYKYSADGSAVKTGGDGTSFVTPGKYKLNGNVLTMEFEGEGAYDYQAVDTPEGFIMSYGNYEYKMSIRP